MIVPPSVEKSTKKARRYVHWRSKSNDKSTARRTWRRILNQQIRETDDWDEYVPITKTLSSWDVY
jgi:hypothetical protein